MLQNPDFPRVFRIPGQFLWPSVAPMQLGAWRRAALYFASRCPNRVVVRVARVVKTLGFCIPPGRARVVVSRGIGIRTG
jgi:hypothetical protein